MMTGFGFFAGRKLVTIFTAPRYQSEQQNLGGIILVDEDGHIGITVMRPPSPDEGEKEQKSFSASCFTGKEAEGAVEMKKAREEKAMKKEKEREHRKEEKEKGEKTKDSKNSKELGKSQ